MTTTTPNEDLLKEETLSTESSEQEHADHLLFGLATFLIADGMTFAGFFAAYLTYALLLNIGLV